MSLEEIKNKLDQGLALSDDQIDEIIDNFDDSSYASVVRQTKAQVNQFAVARDAAGLIVRDILN